MTKVFFSWEWGGKVEGCQIFLFCFGGRGPIISSSLFSSSWRSCFLLRILEKRNARGRKNMVTNFWSLGSQIILSILKFLKRCQAWWKGSSRRGMLGWCVLQWRGVFFKTFTYKWYAWFIFITLLKEQIYTWEN